MKIGHVTDVRLSEQQRVVTTVVEVQIDTLGDHLCTGTDHSGTKKAHDWEVDTITDLFHTTHEVKS